MLIETERLTLRAIEPGDAGFLTKLFNEANLDGVDAPMDLIYPISEEEEASWISSLPSRSNEAHMIVEKRRGRVPLGTISVDKME